MLLLFLKDSGGVADSWLWVIKPYKHVIVTQPSFPSPQHKIKYADIFKYIFLPRTCFSLGLWWGLGLVSTPVPLLALSVSMVVLVLADNSDKGDSRFLRCLSYLCTIDVSILIVIGNCPNISYHHWIKRYQIISRMHSKQLKIKLFVSNDCEESGKLWCRIFHYF